MKNNLLYCPIALLLCISCNNKDSGRAEIKFSQDSFLFNKIRRGDSIIGVFEFTNTGKADLEIKKLGPGCGCTNAYVLNNKLRPGESSKLLATYHSDKDSGVILKTIIVESNTTPILHTLYIKGKVE